MDKDTAQWYNFTLTTPITDMDTSGSTIYYIQIIEGGGPSDVRWFLDTGNPYPNGSLYYGPSPTASDDYLFRTYYDTTIPEYSSIPIIVFVSLMVLSIMIHSKRR